jgi:Tfp pilus assembly protein PilF
LAVRTFLDAFPHVQLWYFPPIGRFTMTNTFLVGSNGPVEIDPAWMRRTMGTDPGSFQGIRKYGLTTAEAVLAHYVGNEETLRRALPPGPVNTFEEPYYEFYSPRDYAVPPNDRTLVNHELLMSVRGPDFERFVKKGVIGPEAGRLNAAFQAEGIFLNGHGSQLRGLPTDEVIRHYDQAIAMAPWNGNLRNEVVSYLNSEYLRYYFSGNYAEATALLRRAVEIYPESSDAHHDYGWMLLKMNQTDLAVKELQQALALRPGLVPARRLLASIYESHGQVEKAREQWQEALALDPKDVPTLVGYGIFLAEQRPGAEAVEYVQKAYQLDPDDPDVIDGYARVEYLSGNNAEAQRIVLKGGHYYEGNPFFEKLRAIILGTN